MKSNKVKNINLDNIEVLIYDYKELYPDLIMEMMNLYKRLVVINESVET